MDNVKGIIFVLSVGSLCLLFIRCEAKDRPSFEGPSVVNVSIKEGNTVTLPCSIVDLNRTIFWTDPDLNLLTVQDRRMLDDGRFFVDRPDNMTWNLVIRDVRRSDQGSYYCKVLNTDPIIQKTINLEVYDATTTPLLTTTLEPITDAETTLPVTITPEPITGPEIKGPSVVNVSVIEGEVATLPCSVANLGMERVFWTNFDGGLVAFDNHRYLPINDRLSVDRPDNTAWNLVFRDVRRSDQGTYRCQITTKPSKQKTIHLKVYDSGPTFKGPSVVNVSIIVGHTVILPCSVKNLGSRQVIWTDKHMSVLTLEDRRLVNDKRLSVDRPDRTTWNLVIRDVRRSDQESYQCLINTKPVKQKTIYLEVNEAPLTAASKPETDILQALKGSLIFKVSVIIGHTVKLPCSFENVGSNQVIWTDKDMEILMLEDRRLVDDRRLSVDHPDRTTWDLVINGVRRSDQGYYQCLINTKPHTQKTIYLEVYDTTTTQPLKTTPEPIKEEIIREVQVNVQENKTAVLACGDRGSGSYEISWFYMDTQGMQNLILRGEEIRGDKRITTSDDGEFSLLIKDIQYRDNGWYMCEINSVPLFKKMFEVKIYGGPKIILQNRMVAQRKGQDVVIDCFVESLPIADVYWLKDGNKLYNGKARYRVVQHDDVNVNVRVSSVVSLWIYDLDESDLGRYECHARNMYGSTMDSVTLFDLDQKSMDAEVQKRQTSVGIHHDNPYLVLAALFESMSQQRNRQALNQPVEQ